MENRFLRVFAVLAFPVLLNAVCGSRCEAQGALLAWGDNSSGQVGDGSGLPFPTPYDAPVFVVDSDGTGVLTGVVAAAGGHSHSLALKADGTVWAWGSGDFLDLGIGASTVNYSHPVQVQDPASSDGMLHDVKAIAAGYHHSLALKNDGTVWGWGLDSQGELGDGMSANNGYPSQALLAPDGAAALTGVVAIATGFGHGLALTGDGKVYAFGSNERGQIGQGTFGGTQPFAIQVPNLPTIKAIAAGGEFSLALDVDGHVWAWGINDLGRLGNCEPDDSALPVEVLTGGPGTNCIGGLGGLITWPAVTSPGPALGSITAIAANTEHAMALDALGVVWIWGGNQEGALGDGVVEYPFAPYANDSQLPPYGTSAALSLSLANVVSIAAGYESGHAITNDGKVWGWGYDLYGNVGNGTVITSSPQAVTAPTLVSNTSSVAANGLSAVASGWLHHFLIVNPNVVFLGNFDN